MADDDESPSNSALLMDRGKPIGNTEDVFGRRAAHVKIGNLPDEPIPVFVTSSTAASESVVSVYGQSLAVPANTPTTVLSYTVPSGFVAHLERVECSGSNIGTYELIKNGVTLGKRRTWFNGPMSECFEFLSQANGLALAAGDVITLTIVHARPYVGDFEARLQTLLIGV